MVLIQLECNHFAAKKAVAWHERDTILTRKGQLLRDQAFLNIHIWNYQYIVQENNDHWNIQVGEKKGGNVQLHTVVIKKEAGTHGSRFGTCTFGSAKVLGVPCEHMVVVVKLGRIPDLTEENVMPYWWTIAQMRLQYPQVLDYVAGMDMSILKEMGPPDHSLYYCPNISGPKKTGCPKNGNRIRGAIEGSGRGHDGHCCGRGGGGRRSGHG